MLPYYQKLNLELSYEDWRFLNYLSDTYNGKVNPFVHMGHETHFYKDFFLRASDKSYRDNILFKKIADLFIEGSQYNSSDWVFDYSQISVVKDHLPIHRDRRTCVITIPLTPIKAPIKWYSSKDEADFLYDYSYDCPATLVNTKLLHGSPGNQDKRIFFQVGGFGEDLTDVVKHLR